MGEEEEEEEEEEERRNRETKIHTQSFQKRVTYYTLHVNLPNAFSKLSLNDCCYY